MRKNRTPQNYEKVIVISAVNLTEGGTLSILHDCLKSISQHIEETEYKVIALVNSKKYEIKLAGIEYIEFPNSKKSYLLRFYYEYFYFFKWSKKIVPEYWISLHDMTPNVCAKHRYVYMHNPSPFYKVSFADLKNRMWKNILFSMFYKWAYRINVKKNEYLIVQQDWFRNEISKLCKFDKNKIIVAYPELEFVDMPVKNKKSGKTTFFYPAFPRPFKNIEVVCKAADILHKTNPNFIVYFTIDGSENNYSASIVKKYEEKNCIKFIGRISRERVFELYDLCAALVFPSKLETWGLPISEFKRYRKKMILADMPYAHESASGAESVAFFDPNDEMELAEIMGAVIMGNDGNYFAHCENLKIHEPYCSNWRELLWRIIPKTEK